MKLLLFVVASCSICTGMKVLIATPTVIKSIHGLLSSIAIGLGDAGHEVTFITPFPLPKRHQNVTTIVMEQIQAYTQEFNMFEFRDSTEIFKLMKIITEKNIKDTWSDERVMEIWRNRNEYDIFMTMSYFYEMNFPFLMNFTGYFVQLCTPGVEAVSLSREGNWLTPAVVPAVFLNYDDQMTFWERSLNLPGSIRYYQEHEAAFKATKEGLLEFFPNIEDLHIYYDRVVLTLINGNFALDGSVPLLPSQVEIGTINARKPQPLPKDLEDFVSGSGDAGVIYFSLGSLAKSHDIPKRAKEMFVEAFLRVPQRVLWKYEGTDLQLPPNVKTQKWMPQQDILGHPKTRVFISHCGNLGIHEAKYHGVPIIGIPIAFDQSRNAARMERKGYGIVLQWEELTTDKIVASLEMLLNDTTYKDRLQSLSRVIQDQRDNPTERAVWWLEYVVRHKGAPHLQYAGRRLSLFQYIMLDVILFWTAVLFVIILCVVYIIKRLCCRMKTNDKPSEQKKKKIQ